MELYPIQSFKDLSTGKKAAVVAGAAAVTAAVVTTGVAISKGKKICLATDKFTTTGEGADAKKHVKLLDALKEGYKSIAQSIKAKLPNKKAEAAPAADKTPAAPAETVANEASTAAENA